MGTSPLLFLQIATQQTVDSPPIPHPTLNAIGHLALDHADAQIVALSILGLLVILWLAGRPFAKRWATMEEVFKAGIAMVTLVSGATIAIVLLLTNPPAFEKLNGESRWIPAAVTLAFTAKHGIEQIYATFFKRK